MDVEPAQSHIRYHMSNVQRRGSRVDSTVHADSFLVQDMFQRFSITVEVLILELHLM